MALILSASTLPAQAPLTAPATVEQAAAVIDFTKFPLIDGASPPNHRAIASVSYSVPVKVLDATGTIRRRLAEAGWKAVEGATFTDQYSSAVYQKQGFTLSLSVMPGSSPQEASINLINHGNVDLKSIPVVKDAKLTYAFPSGIMYVTAQPAAAAKEASLKLLRTDGWKPFGDTTVSFFVRKNAVRLQVMVQEAPAQGGQTAIQISSEQLSHDYPAPPDAVNLQYSDGNGGLLFDSPRSQPDIEKFFREQLATRGWKATTERPVKISFWDHVIFRNAAGELLDLKLQDFEGKTRSTIEYQSKEEVDRLFKIAKEEAAKKAAELARPPVVAKIGVRLPVGGKISKQQAGSIELQAATGKGKATTQAWIKQFEADGWKTKIEADEQAAGVYELTKGSQTLRLIFVDPGIVIPAEITLTVSGSGQLEVLK